MSLHVACSSCHTTFPVETHAGLVRCSTCEDRAAPRMQATPGHIVDVPADSW